MGQLSSQEISELTARYTYGTWRFQRGWKPLHIADAEGCYFIDGNGKRYLDFSSQLMCVTLAPAAVSHAYQKIAIDINNSPSLRRKVYDEVSRKWERGPRELVCP